MNLREADKHFIHTYNRSVIFEKGEECTFLTTRAINILTWVQASPVSALGYSNDEYKQALKDQIDKLIHVSNLYFTEPSIKAAEYLSKASGMDKVFFTNSGTEAIEGAIKLARKYAYNKDKNSKGEIIAMNILSTEEVWVHFPLQEQNITVSLLSRLSAEFHLQIIMTLKALRNLQQKIPVQLSLRHFRERGVSTLQQMNLFTVSGNSVTRMIYYLYLMRYSVEWEEPERCLHTSIMV